MKRTLCALVAAAGICLTTPAITPAMAQPTPTTTTAEAPSTTAAPTGTANPTSAPPSTSVPSTAPTVSLPEAPSPLPGPDFETLPDYSQKLTSSCAIDVNNDVWCWGPNDRGQLGNGTSGEASTSPVKIPNFKAQAISRSYSTCAIDLEGKPWCWGESLSRGRDSIPQFHPFFPTPIPIEGIPADVKLQKISVTIQQACAIDTNNEVWCWGDYEKDEKGNFARFKPAQKSSLIKKAKEISVAYAHGCYIDMNNQTYCWGNNRYGQLGKNPVVSQDGLSKLGDFKAVKVITGTEHTCLLDDQGHPHCWGRDRYNLLGGTPDANGEIAMTDIVATSFDATGPACVVDQKRTPWCWGYSFGARVGNTPQPGTEIPSNDGNIKVNDAVTVKTVGSSVYYVDNSGQLWGWGTNNKGYLGVGNTDPQPTPVKIPGIKIF